MVKLVLLAGVILVAFIADATCQRLVLPTSAYRPSVDRPQIILPTYRPPVHRGPIIRTARQANQEPEWMWKGDNIERAPTTADHPVLPSVIDDIKLNPNRRYTRSKDSPSAKSYGRGSSSSNSGSRNTGPTHPGYNRRNARSIRSHDIVTLRPKPFDPSPFDPSNPRINYPIYARTVRDVQFPGIKKPTYRDVVIPNWNPNVRTNPWGSLGGRRKTRSLENPGKEDEIYHDYYDVVRQE